ncbi:restriction endonuclease subunit S, partial [Escherichia coli]|nr:restriction endonuclease subunit S [Escherichia coli]EGO8050831.1 restriction endonuclease subunit S [Escherichia coli]EHA4100311.1 restriction endonuclease subunit S [Escherichia coli]EHL9069827.1 restriction endonuclease subunit S [Escherichia coli]EHT0861005.1 restriction endonuclease subunit S [Escherichia coli]
SNAITTIIGEHLLIRNGKSSPSRAITGEYPVYGSNGIIGYSDEYNANENTIIIGRVGSYCGSVYISGKKCWVTDNAIIGTAKNENESHFWFYLLKKIDLNNYSTGSGQPLINQTIINTISVTIPKLSEKRVSIGHFLRHFDQKINLSLNINQSLEQMSQTLFKSWFVDFDPVIDNALDAGNPIPEALQSRAELRQKVRSSADFKPLLVEIRSLFPSEFEETELGWVPKGWTLKSVAKSININPSIKLPKNKIAKYVDMKSLPTQGYSISDIIEKPYSGGAKFQNNDTLFARITPCLENGKTGFVDFLDEKETAFGSTEFIVMRGTPQVHYLYVACLARENNFRLHAIQNMVGSSGRQRVQNSCFDSFYIAIPTPAVMSLFSGKVSSYFDKMYFCNLENKSLTALRDTLLPKLISGELSLDDLPDLTTDTEAA